MKPKTVWVTVRVPEPLRKKAVKEAKKQDTTVSQVVRQALRELVESGKDNN